MKTKTDSTTQKAVRRIDILRPPGVKVKTNRPKYTGIVQAIKQQVRPVAS